MVNPVEICVNAVLELTNPTELTETRSISRMKGSWSSSIHCKRMKTVDSVYFQINWMKIKKRALIKVMVLPEIWTVDSIASFRRHICAVLLQV